MKRLYFILPVILLIAVLFYNCASPAVKNGNDGTNGAPGPGITWVDVTGTSVQAESNKGYLADSASQVTITLPASPAFGDIIEVSGVGTGGWKIAQNSAQYVITKEIACSNFSGWAPRDSSRSWYSVASSSDGTKLAAVVFIGQIYTSLIGNNTTPGTAGNISGNQYEAIRLQYMGNNIFTILSHEGDIIGQ